MITIQFREPSTARYIYVNPTNNHVHLMLPVVGGIDISSDNTCKATTALKTSMGKQAGASMQKQSALNELQRYKRALQYDLSLIQDNSNSIKQQKIARLKQIEEYLAAMNVVQSHVHMNSLNEAFPFYPKPIQELIDQKSNLYSMVLRPDQLDNFVRVKDPVFSVARKGSQVFYTALNRGYQTLVIGKSKSTTQTATPQELLKAAVLKQLQSKTTTPTFEEIQKAVKDCAQDLGSTLDVATGAGIGKIDKNSVDTSMGFDSDSPASPAEYVDALIGFCAGHMNPVQGSAATQAPSLFNIQNTAAGKEKLSILTQFFLGQVNIYCYANKLSTANFGGVLENSGALSNEVVAVVKQALQNGAPVEQALFHFINAHQKEFSLSRPLQPNEMSEIQQTFTKQFQMIDGSQHYDDFTVLYANKPGKFVTHQGAICVDFADVIGQGFNNLDSPYFRDTRHFSERVERVVPNSNDAVAANFEIQETELTNYLRDLLQDPANNDTIVELLLSKTDTKQKLFQRLPDDAKEALMQSPNWKMIMQKIAGQITDVPTRQAFNAAFLGTNATQLAITNDIARALYIAAIVKYGPARCPESYETSADLQALMTILDIRDITSLEESVNDGFIVTCPLATADVLNQVISANQNRFYLTPEMAISLYKEATSQYSGDSAPEIVRMNALSNQGHVPHKMIEALRLLDIHITPQQIGFPGSGIGGYIFSPLTNGPADITAFNSATQSINDIHQNQTRFHLTPELAINVYRYVDQMGQGSQIANLNNNAAPHKIRRALEILGLATTNLSFNASNGYWLNASPAVLKILRGEEPLRLTGIAGSRSRRNPMVFLQAARPVQLNAARMGITGLGGHRAATISTTTHTSSSTSISAATTITVERVSAFVVSQPLPTNANQVQLNCPDAILAEFRNLLRGTAILGCSFANPYTGATETIPTDVNNLTARHLQVLARNEQRNVTGVMQNNLYNGKLTADQIARLRCLVKATNVVGVVLAHHFGGYGGSTPVAISPPQRTILIDQSGIQWQGDYRNTGGMFFYPDNLTSTQLPQGYAAWQTAMYQAMYGHARPSMSSNTITINWGSVAGRIDLNQVRNAIDAEFSQALDAAVSHGDAALGASERINFKYLKAGMGFFAFNNGLPPREQLQLELARLQGIEQALQRIATLPTTQRQTALGKVGRIVLPFSSAVRGNPTPPANFTDTLTRIQGLVQNLGLAWGGAGVEDALKPQTGFVCAMNNTGDPHAMPGNEGGQASVDASISSNADINHINAAFNLQMQLRASPLCNPPAIMSVLASVSTSSTDVTTQLASSSSSSSACPH